MWVLTTLTQPNPQSMVKLIHLKNFYCNDLLLLVFSTEDGVKYLYSFMDKDESQDKCISTLCVGEISKDSEERIMITGVFDSFKLWRIAPQ